jgi:hypothetical protein
MSGEIDRTARFDMRVLFDVGSYNAAAPGEALGGVTSYITVLEPYGIYDDSLDIRMGARFGISGYFSGDKTLIEYSGNGENPAGGVETSTIEGIKGVRSFLGLELEIPMSDAVSLRFSPGVIFKNDNFCFFDYGAAVVSELMVDLASWAVFILHFTSDVYTWDRTEQFIGGLGFGFTV